MEPRELTILDSYFHSHPEIIEILRVFYGDERSVGCEPAQVEAGQGGIRAGRERPLD